MTKEEKIERLKKGIAAETTPDHIRKLMQEELDELQKPEPAPVVKKKPGNPNLKKGEKNIYYVNKKKKAEEEARLKAEEEAKKRREFTAEEKEAIKAEYARRRAKKKAKIEEE